VSGKPGAFVGTAVVGQVTNLATKAALGAIGVSLGALLTSHESKHSFTSAELFVDAAVPIALFSRQAFSILKSDGVRLRATTVCRLQAVPASFFTLVLHRDAVVVGLAFTVGYAGFARLDCVGGRVRAAVGGGVAGLVAALVYLGLDGAFDAHAGLGVAGVGVVQVTAAVVVAAWDALVVVLVADGKGFIRAVVVGGAFRARVVFQANGFAGILAEFVFVPVHTFQAIRAHTISIRAKRGQTQVRPRGAAACFGVGFIPVPVPLMAATAGWVMAATALPVSVSVAVAASPTGARVLATVHRISARAELHSGTHHNKHARATKKHC